MFWALFLLLLFKFIQAQLSCLSLWASLIYNQLYFLNLRVFWMWVVHPSLNSMNKWIFSIFTFHCVWIHTFPALCMKYHIIFKAVWFVHLGNQFASSWVYGWVSYYITEIEQIESFSYQVQFVYEWRSSWLAFIRYSNLGTIIFPSDKTVPSNFSSMHWIVMLVRFVYGLVLLHNLCSSMFWTIISQVSSRLKL